VDRFGRGLNVRRYACNLPGRDEKATVQFSRVVSVMTEASTRNSPIVPLTVMKLVVLSKFLVTA
jgi:hypothetical protein